MILAPLAFERTRVSPAATGSVGSDKPLESLDSTESMKERRSVTPWTKWPALGQPVYVRSDSVNGSVNGIVFASAGVKRALLRRMGTGPNAWAYLDTLARAAGMSRNALEPKLKALKHEGLVASTKAPAGLRYRLTEDGRRFRRAG